MDTKPSISIVLPAHNEEDNIRKTVIDAADFLKTQDFLSQWEVIVVDDGSTDRTGAILGKLADHAGYLKVVTHSKNAGYGQALASGVGEARFPWVLMMDADGQFKIDALKNMIHYVPDYDIVTGYRLKRTDPFHRVFIGRMYTFLACMLFGLKLRDVNCGFKLFRKEVLDFDGPVCHAGAFYTGIYVRAKRQDCRVKEIPVEHFPRVGGRQTGASLKVAVTAMVDLCRLSFSKTK